MNTEMNFDALRKQNRLLKVTISSISISLVLMLTIAFTTQKKEVKYFDEIVVKKFSMIDSTGVKRIEMTTDLATAPFAGEQIERNIPPNMAAIIFMNPNGDEIGGLGFGGDENMTFALNAFDYTGIPLEAIGYNRIQAPDFSSAQFVVMDSPRKDSDFDINKFIEDHKSGKLKDGEVTEQVKLLQEQMVSRVNLGVENHNAALVLMDQKGNQRIVLEVNDKNEAVFKIMDENGKVVQQFPDK